MKKKIAIIVIALVTLIILIQIIPVKRDNPEVTGKFTEHSEVMMVVQRCCYDCHSNETVWPWYSYVAPVSWLVAHDVHEGRGHLNFSEWQLLPYEKRVGLQSEIWDEVQSGKMPPSGYLAMHKNAKITDSDRSILKRWAVDESSRNGSLKVYPLPQTNDK